MTNDIHCERCHLDVGVCAVHRGNSYCGDYEMEDEMSGKYRCQLVKFTPIGECYPIGGEFVFGEFRRTIFTPIPITVNFTTTDDRSMQEPIQVYEWEYFADDAFGRLLYKMKELE